MALAVNKAYQSHFFHKPRNQFIIILKDTHKEKLEEELNTKKKKRILAASNYYLNNLWIMIIRFGKGSFI